MPIGNPSRGVIQTEYGAVAGSESISDFNPDDIESISVLTGPSAAALYGAAAANGVILINTKKGSEGKMKINFSSNTEFSKPMISPEFQNSYGNRDNSYRSWGEKLATPSSFDPMDFFKTGMNTINSLNISSGTKTNQTFISLASTNSKGVIKNNEYYRYNFSFRNTALMLDDKLHVDLGASYVIQAEQNMISGGRYFNPLFPLYLFPRGEDFENVKIFERFRSACDEFFKCKAEFFKSVKENMSGNLEKKKELCEKAEALKDSTDWKTTAEVLSKLQKEWKTIGPVPKKYSEMIWKRFIGACDYFFDQKNKATSSQRSVEQENMVLKKEIIEKLNAINAQETPEEDADNTIRELMKEWNTIGHVPFKEKDKLYKQYHAIIDKLFDKLNLSASQKKLSNFKSNIGKEGNIYREREKLVRAYENMKNEIQTYENNLGFLTSSSKKGSNLVTEMNRKVEKLKADLELILKKIEIIDQSMSKE